MIEINAKELFDRINSEILDEEITRRVAIKVANLLYEKTNDVNLLLVIDTLKSYKTRKKQRFLEQLAEEEFIKELNVDTRKLPISIRRQFVMWWLHKVKGYTLDRAGALFNKDHSTVIYACKMVRIYHETKDSVALSYMKEVEERLKERGYM
jgi:chromosomal replication initiation ATPase DnaA